VPSRRTTERRAKPIGGSQAARRLRRIFRHQRLDHDFRPLRRQSRGRIAGLREAFPDGVMPPIAMFEVDGAYFVEDRHHRVALARERGTHFIDADVTRLLTNYEVPPGVDVSQLVHTEQQRILLEETGLGRARPRR
jgi:hypothetical protein